MNNSICPIGNQLFWRWKRRHRWRSGNPEA
jgi:hypothetical protein